jgi:hypothetical protein
MASWLITSNEGLEDSVALSEGGPGLADGSSKEGQAKALPFLGSLGACSLCPRGVFPLPVGFLLFGGLAYQDWLDGENLQADSP